MVEEAENILNEHGFADVRVRYYDNTAKIEVPESMITSSIRSSEKLKFQLLELGFDDCAIDEEGLVSGKLNRAIANVK